ncbi:MAG: MATE family efflux transporter [Bradymonadia bacterium]
MITLGRQGPDAPLFAVLKLAGPLVVAYAGQQLMSVVDAAVVGRISAEAMAGTSLAGGLFAGTMVLGMGVLGGMDPLASQGVGAGDLTRARRVYGAALKLSRLMSLPLTALLALAWWLLHPIGVDPASIQECGVYLVTRCVGLLPLFMYISGRGMAQSMGHGRPVLVATIGANLINVPMSVYLAFTPEQAGALGLGHIGAGLGVAGVGLASTASSLLQLWIMHRSVKAIGGGALPPAPGEVAEVFRMGWPIGLQLGAEVGIFAGVTVLMGRFGPVVTSGHHVALMLASFTFTICMGLSGATSAMVGQAVGEGDLRRARAAGRAGLGAAAVFMGCNGLMFWTFAEPLAWLLTDKGHVVQVAIPLLHVAALFQVSDGLQAVGAGAWRGLGRTRAPMIMNLVGHWAVGFPLAMWLAYGTTEGPRGLWWGLTAGLTAVALLLAIGFEIVALKTPTPSTPKAG